MKRRILVLGGSSQLTPLLLERLDQDAEIVVTTTSAGSLQGRSRVTEVSYPRDSPEALAEKLHGGWTAAISLVPVSVLPRLLPALETAEIGRLVALSTASVKTKVDSRSADERKFLESVKAGEGAFHAFVEKTRTPGVLLRPAMTYGGGDNNVDFIRRMAQRFGFFPVVRHSGLRQPVHVADVADAIMAALESPRATGNTYFLAGGERLTFEQMAKRILRAELGHERVLPIPGVALAFTLGALARVPRFAFLDPDMARRMREDHVFDNEPARRDLGFSPRGFLA